MGQNLKSTSIYREIDENGKNIFSIKKFMVPIRRGIILVVCFLLLVSTYFYATKGQVNHGIISSIFSTSLINTSIWFRIKHGQKLNKSQILGILSVILCVIMISLGGKSKNTNNDPKLIKNADEIQKYRYIAILLAILEGIFFSIRTADMQISQQLGVPSL